MQAAFVEKCLSHADVLQPTARTHPPVSSPGSSLVSPLDAASGSVAQLDTTRLIDAYPAAYSDTYGLLSRAPFVYKTGSPWPTPDPGPEAYPFRRKLHPISNHPIAPMWDQILADTQTYLDNTGKTFNGIVPLGFGNVGAPVPFCPLVVTICVEPQSIGFDDAKTVADHVKTAILSPAAFGDIDVAIWELSLCFSAAARLPALDPMLEGPSISPFRHPFTSTLGLAIAPFDDSRCEGTLGLYMTRGNDLLGITAAHVVRPPGMFPENAGLPETSSEKRIDHVVALGEEAYRRAVYQVEKEIGTLRRLVEAEGVRIEGLHARLDGGADDSSGRIADAIYAARCNIRNANTACKSLNGLHDEVTKLMAIVDNRVIGRVLYADSIGVTSEQGYTRDWAAIKMAPNAFSEDFRGNKMYIGDTSEATFRTRMFPHAAESAGYAYPEYGLLQLSGVVPESELAEFPHLNANGDPALAAVKNGTTTGTTFGWVSQLAALVHHYNCGSHQGFDFWSRELTVVSHADEPGPFSGKGDSGSVIADRRGRIIGLLTGGGSGPSNSTDVTFATPFCHLLPRIEQTLPEIRFYDSAT